MAAFPALAGGFCIFKIFFGCFRDSGFLADLSTPGPQALRKLSILKGPNDQSRLFCRERRGCPVRWSLGYFLSLGKFGETKDMVRVQLGYTVRSPSRSAFSKAPCKLLLVDFGRKEYRDGEPRHFKNTIFAF